MSQYKENNYAPKKRKLEKGNLREHQNRNGPRQAPEAKYSDSNEQSRKIQEEKIGIQNEEWREEESVEAHQEGRSGIQESDCGRQEVGESTEKQEEVEFYATPAIIWEPQVLNDAWVVNLSKVEEKPKKKSSRKSKLYLLDK